MFVLLVLFSAATCYWAGSRFYGGQLEKWLDVRQDRPTPAVRLNDGRDYVPARPFVLFAHHFAAIAGAGPIVGPTLAFAFGVMPALIWVVVGAIFIGAVHDMSSLVVSVREGGRSIAEVARRVFGEAGYGLILGLLLVSLLMITATFLNLSVVALTSSYPAAKVGLTPPAEETLREIADQHPGAAFVNYRAHPWMPTTISVRAIEATDAGVPQGEVLAATATRSYTLMARIGGIASTSVLFITLCAPFLGWLIYRRSLLARYAYPLATVLCAISVLLGLKHPVLVSAETWRGFMTIYVVAASTIPVWMLLMPRDFVNVQILYAGIVGIFIALLVTAFGSVATGAPPSTAAAEAPYFSYAEGVQYVGALWPLMLITVSCGAISGFHCLVATGTSAKQLSNETHARRIGYNGMLLESLLAVTVILTLYVGLGHGDYLQITHREKNPILAISLATGNLAHQAFGSPVWMGTVFGILLLEGFVVTTLDVAVRLNRYLLEELWKIALRQPPAWMLNVWFNTALAALGMYALSRWNVLPVLWRVFGSANQMMAAMALLVVAVWMRAHRRKFLFALIPSIFMFVTTVASTAMSLSLNLEQKNFVLSFACLVLLCLAVGMVILSVRVFRRPPVAPANEPSVLRCSSSTRPSA
ncbi:MAG TPA: carbon starvation CstA family protein [Candidatus Paceibacterota bacterium]|nr:carbon starvation CstA family protein [Candidatus Paceibacterota bacterium]HRZ56462.1 carbon starvation CstA family protein [Candidatus Paceibacterota bacterium]